MALVIGELNCTTGAIGTGTAGCVINPNNITNIVLVEKGWNLDESTDTLDQSSVDGYVQDGKMYFLPAHFGREDASEEYVYETSEIGVKLKVRAGNVEMLVTYAKGVCFSKALESLSNKKLDLLLVDYEGGVSRLWGAYSNGKFKGFDLALNNAENFQLPTGTTGAKKPLRLQFSPKGTVEFNQMMNFLVSSGVDFGSIEGVNDVVIESLTTSASDFKIELRSACDKTTTFEGFDAPASWQVLDNTGTPVVPSSVTYADGVYTLVGISAGTYTIRLYDGTASSPIVVEDSMYYKSNTISVTLT